MSIDVQRNEIDATGLVAEEIRALLARKRMSGRELARHLDVSPSWVSYRLTGSQPIDVNDLAAIAGVLQVNMVDLLPREQRTVTRGYPDEPKYVPLPELATRFVTSLPKQAPPSGLRRTARTGY